MRRIAVLLGLTLALSGCGEKKQIAESCIKSAKAGLREVADRREDRFLGKVSEDSAICRGGPEAAKYRNEPWVDWQSYWATGDESSKSGTGRARTVFGRLLKRDDRGRNGALLDLEYQRIELIKFNLFDNYTFEQYLDGMGRTPGPALSRWDQLRLPPDHPRYEDVGGDGEHLCEGDLIRHRNITGICNDIKNPLMGSTNTYFARNVQHESTFPRLGFTQLTRNRHADRLSLLRPDPQVISRRLFTREQSDADRCREGFGSETDSSRSHCDYKKAPFFNVLAAFWIQFMNHDWFSHLREGHNTDRMMKVGCATRRAENGDVPLTPEEVEELGCRPEDEVDEAYVAEEGDHSRVSVGGCDQFVRSPRRMRNTVTAWWDASQIYGYDEISARRVKRDPADRAKLAVVQRGEHHGEGERYGYLPLFETCDGEDAGAGCTPDPINPSWAGQEATAFPDNWTLGLSFYHNLFVREHNIIVDEFRKRAASHPNRDSGLRNPADPDRPIAYKDITPDELFEVARLIVAAEIAKIHTIEWTPQLLYNDPLHRAMNANWSGLFEDSGSVVAEVLAKIMVESFGPSDEIRKHNKWYSVFAAGPGIVGLGNVRYEKDGKFSLRDDSKTDIWDLSNPDHVNGGVNHFGSPFNFPEEFVSVYRLHPLLPDLIELREWNSPNVVRDRIPIVTTFRGRATREMERRGLASVAVSMGRQRLGALTLQNHPLFLQNLHMPRLQSATNKIDVAALDIIRDRERGVPRFNEFRRQIGLRQLTSFDDFIDPRLEDGPERREQERIVEILADVYGRHKCDASKIITVVQLNEDGSPINDCLGAPDGSMVDNVEDIDTVVGYLAEFARPHGFAISETQFQIFILNASRRLFSDRFFTSSFRPEFYGHLGVRWVNNNGPGPKQWVEKEVNGHVQEVSPLKRVMLRAIPELSGELEKVVNMFDPWARSRGEYYSLEWAPRADAATDESFASATGGAGGVE